MELVEETDEGVAWHAVGFLEHCSSVLGALIPQPKVGRGFPRGENDHFFRDGIGIRLKSCAI